VTGTENVVQTLPNSERSTNYNKKFQKHSHLDWNIRETDKVAMVMISVLKINESELRNITNRLVYHLNLCYLSIQTSVIFVGRA